MVSALFEDMLSSFFSSSGSDYFQPGSPGELDSRGSDPAARAMYQHGLAGHCLCPMEKGLIGSKIRDTDPGALFKGDIFRQGMHKGFGTEGFFGISALYCGSNVAPVAGRKAVDAFADRLNYARAILARGIGQGRLHRVLA